MRGRRVALGLVVALATACTSQPEPAPEPTATATPVVPVDQGTAPPHATVVLAVPRVVAAGVVDDHRAAVARVDAEVTALDVDLALGVGGDVQADLAGLALDGGALAVCVVGRDAVAVALAAAASRPSARVCAVPDPVDSQPPPVAPQVLAFVPDGDDLRRVFTRAVVSVLGDEGRVGLVVDRPATSATMESALRAALEAAVPASADGPDDPAPEEPPTAVDDRIVVVALQDAGSARAAGRELVRAGVDVAVVGVGVDLAELRAGTGGTVLLAGPAGGLLDGGDEVDVLVAWTYDVTRPLALALGAAGGEAWPTGVVEVGFADGVLGLRAGGAEAGPAAIRAVEQDLEELREGPVGRLPPPPQPTEVP